MIKIRVEERHIKRGKPRNGCDCAVALAIKERIEDGAWVGVRKTWAVVNGHEIRLSKRVHCFIDDFDEGNPAKPFAFMADIPGHLLRVEQ